MSTCRVLRRRLLAPFVHWAVALALLAGGAPLHAQQAPSEPRAARSLRAQAKSAPVVLDGRLTDVAWTSAPLATDFVQREPIEGQQATARTEVRVLFDEAALYVGARLFDAQPGAIARQLVRRDEQGQYDYFEFGVDPHLDRRTGYVFRVNAANVQRDEFLFDDRERDVAFDAVWTSAVQVDSLGWCVEMRIPLSQLRYEASAEEQTWGVNFARRQLRTNEESHFALISRLQQGVISQFGTLTGIRAPRAAQRLELRPYVLGGGAFEPGVAGNPLADGSSYISRAGLDVRLGLGSGLTLDATFNPDFGQVEADPAVINLSAFETFFEERRPFFVEDARIFDFTLSGGRNRLFYSRRVGRRPQGSAPEGTTFSDRPDAATIVGAVKFTGRTAGGLSIGAIGAVTDAERGSAYFESSGATQRFLAEPRAGYGVLRLRQDYSEGASTVGAMATLLHRQLPGDRSFHYLPATATNGGVDWEHQWGSRTWAFFGYLAGSYLRGDSTAMIRLQRASQHYFQRPDALRLHMDSSATSMMGIDWRATLEKRRGAHWTGSVWAAQVSPGFEVNDLGFSGRAEVLDGGARVQYRQITPGKRFRSYSYSVSTFHNWSHDALEDAWSASSWGRAHLSGSVSSRVDAQFLNYWSLEGNLTLRPETMDRTATRGGPLMLTPKSLELRGTLRSDRRRRLSAESDFTFERRANGAGRRTEFGVDLTWRPSSRTQITLEPKWQASRIGAQYITTSGEVPFAPTFGKRYLFGELERHELSMATRVNVTFSRMLSLQLYAQPLLSSGDYVSYKQFSAPRTYRFSTFGEGTYAMGGTTGRCEGGTTCVDGSNVRYFDFTGDGAADYSMNENDFNVRSLIGNAVLRWEYRPGSTIFLVWQRRQLNSEVVGDFALSRDLGALWRARSSNVFMLKATYWIGR